VKLRFAAAGFIPQGYTLLAGYRGY